MENNVTEVNFSKCDIKEDIKEGVVPEITDEIISRKLENVIERHLSGVKHLINNEDFIKINKDYNMDIIGLSSVFITEISNGLGLDIHSLNLSNKVQDFIESLSFDLSIHPADISVILIKILSDILLQVVVTQELLEEVKNK